MDVAATVEVGALSGENNTEGRSIGSRRQLVTGCHRAGLNVLGAKNPRNFTTFGSAIPQPEEDDLEAAVTADKHSSSSAGSARQMGCFAQTLRERRGSRSFFYQR